MGNGNNWDQLVRLIVPLSFLAIWAITSLFNRESAPVPRAGGAPRPGPGPGPGPRAGEPTLRWADPNAGQARRPPGNGAEDDILVIRPSANLKGGPARNGPSGPGLLASRRGQKVKPVAAPPKRPEPVASRPKLAGVTQNVNQQLTRSTLDMAPLTTLSPSATSTTIGLSTAESAPSKSTYLAPSTVLATSLRDPARLREAFLVNELLMPPVALRARKSGRG